MRGDVQGRVEPRDRLRLAARCRDAEEGRRRRRTEDDRAVAVPGAADAPCRVADGEGGPAVRVDLLQGSLREVTDEPAVGRPEGEAGFLGACYRARRGGAEGPDPEAGLRAGFPRGERKRSPVGRERDRLDERLLGKRDRGEDRRRGARRAAQVPDREDERGHPGGGRERPRELLAVLAPSGDGRRQSGLRAALADPLELELHVVRGLEAVLGSFERQVAIEAVEGRRRHRRDRRDRRRAVLQDRADQARLALAVERLLPGRHLVEDRPEGEDVAPRASASPPSSCSGAMYWNVPRIVPCCVRCCCGAHRRQGATAPRTCDRRAPRPSRGRSRGA